MMHKVRLARDGQPSSRTCRGRALHNPVIGWRQSMETQAGAIEVLMMAATYLVGHVPVRRPVVKRPTSYDLELSPIEHAMMFASICAATLLSSVAMWTRQVSQHRTR